MHHSSPRRVAWAAALAGLFLVSNPVFAQSGVLRATADGFFKALNPPAASQQPPAETAPAPAAPDSETISIPADTRKLTLTVGQTTIVRFPVQPKTVVIDKPSIIDANKNPKNARDLIITANTTPGIAAIDVEDREGHGHHIDITVLADVGPLQQVLDRMYPNASIHVIPTGEHGIAVTGFVESAQDVDPIMETAKQYEPSAINAIQVVGPQTVQLRVLIAEVSRTKLRELGFNFVRGDSNSYFTSSIGGLITVGSVSTPPPSVTFNQKDNFTFGTIGNQHIFRGFLEALKQEGLAKIYAEPTIIAKSGRTASMIIGGEFPIVVPGQQGTFSVEFREYGNRVEFVPVVLGGGRIHLEVRPELSELDYANGVMLQGFTIPGLKQRRVDTAVELRTGETFAVAGLLSTTDTATTNKVPYLGDLAIIGAAFRTVSYQREEKELIIMVTPELVEAIPPHERPCAYPGSESTPPANRELFFLGRVENEACTPCEIARRGPLAAGVAIPAAAAAPDTTNERPVQEASKRATRTMEPRATPPASVDVSARPEARRPESFPAGLLGPLGYDAGR